MEEAEEVKTMRTLKELPIGLRKTVLNLCQEAWASHMSFDIIWKARLLSVVSRHKAALLSEMQNLSGKKCHHLYMLFKKPRFVSQVEMVRRVFAYAQTAFTYENNPMEAEKLTSVASMRPGPQCVSTVAAWLAAHLLAIGVPCELVLWRGQGVSQFHHIYVYAYPTGGSVALDPLYQVKAGREPKGGERLRINIEQGAVVA